MKVNRQDLLNGLLSVEPGLSKGKSIQQSSCVVFRKGRFYTLSQEIACSGLSGLSPDMEGAVQPDKLMALLKQSTQHEEFDIAVESKTLKLTAKGTTLKVPMEETILLPVGDVKPPKVWQLLHEDFTEAIDLAHRCTEKGSDCFTKQCVHIHPEWIEASDNIRFLRFPLTTKVEKSVLVRGESIKEIIGLGMTKIGETEGWLHFFNPLGLRVSVRKFAQESYPDLSNCLKVRGRKAVFPKGLKETAKRAGLFADESIRITVSKEKVVVEGLSEECGHYAEDREVSYDGPSMTFSIPAKVIEELIDKQNEVEITPDTLRVDGDKFAYITSLEVSS